MNITSYLISLFIQTQQLNNHNNNLNNKKAPIFFSPYFIIHHQLTGRLQVEEMAVTADSESTPSRQHRNARVTVQPEHLNFEARGGHGLRLHTVT